MRLNDEDIDEDDYLDDEDMDYEEEEPPKRRVIIRDRDEEEDNFEEPSVSGSSSSLYLDDEKPKAKSNKLSVRSRNKKSSDTGLAVCVIRPHTMEDAKEITDTLLDGCAVVLNVEGLELEIAQRILDFTSGSCYAMNGNLKRISSYIFIITPENVDISGDFQDLISGAFDVPIETRRY